MTFTVKLQFPRSATIAPSAISIELPEDLDVNGAVDMLAVALFEIFKHQPSLKNPLAASEPANWQFQNASERPVELVQVVKEHRTEISLRMKEAIRGPRGDDPPRPSDQDHKLAAAIRKIVVDKGLVKMGAPDVDVLARLKDELHRLEKLDSDFGRLQGERDQFAQQSEQRESRLRQVEKQLANLTKNLK
jgi:hypothetical protein